jgi:hypothetical protein
MTADASSRAEEAARTAAAGQAAAGGNLTRTVWHSRAGLSRAAMSGWP